jgi:HEAT repeat protein
MPLMRSPARIAIAAAPVACMPTTDALLRALRTGASESERRDAARDLATAPQAVEALGVALGNEAAPRVRQEIILALVGIGTAAAAAKLANFLGSEDVALRNAAVEGLQQIGIGAAVCVNDCLASDDRDERILAINVLEALGHEDTRGWLRAVLTRDNDVAVGLAAVEALTQMGEPEDVGAMRDFATRFPDEPFVGFAVNLACRRVAAGSAG